jgi:Ribosomal protein S5
VCEVLGIKDLVAKSLGTANPHNVIRATMKALQNQNSPKHISNLRNKKVSEIIEKRGS